MCFTLYLAVSRNLESLFETLIFFSKKRLSPAIDFCLRTKILHFPSQISSPLYIECRNTLHSINLLTEANIVDTSNIEFENVLKCSEFEKVRGPRVGWHFFERVFNAESNGICFVEIGHVFLSQIPS